MQCTPRCGDVARDGCPSVVLGGVLLLGEGGAEMWRSCLFCVFGVLSGVGYTNVGGKGKYG